MLHHRAVRDANPDLPPFPDPAPALVLKDDLGHLFRRCEDQGVRPGQHFSHLCERSPRQRRDVRIAGGHGQVRAEQAHGLALVWLKALDIVYSLHALPARDGRDVSVLGVRWDQAHAVPEQRVDDGSELLHLVRAQGLGEQQLVEAEVVRLAIDHHILPPPLPGAPFDAEARRAWAAAEPWPPSLAQNEAMTSRRRSSRRPRRGSGAVALTQGREHCGRQAAAEEQHCRGRQRKPTTSPAPSPIRHVVAIRWGCPLNNCSVKLI
mmetsp:Transcript_56023/g.144596  ORF Transcript_56023/g.144596 Transcript_56023/m.144596 type:complete len:264 (+) Transcript_56023:29-820(+)